MKSYNSRPYKGNGDSGIEQSTNHGTQCLNCGSVVTDDYARVMGANGGEVHACPNCTAAHGIGGEAGGVER